MYWLRRPAHLRWAAAALFLAVAAYVDLSTPPTSSHPFVAIAIAEGTAVAPGDIEWREVPEGLLPAPGLDGAVAAHDLEPGEPLLPSSVTIAPPVPSGWWMISLPVPVRAVPGTPIRAVLRSGATVADGVLVEPASPDDYDSIGLAAFPGDSASQVASAAAAHDVVLLIAP